MIHVVGIGPGAEGYILPVAIETIKAAEVVIGAGRNLESIKKICSEPIDLSRGFTWLSGYITENQLKNIAIVVSGDSGFYSLLNFVNRTVDKDNISVIPGISSLQYFYSKLNRGYENVKFISLHGRETDLKPYLKTEQELGILTDQKHNSRYIASILMEHGISNIKMYIGERLSYGDEKISCLTLEEAMDYCAGDLSVVVIAYE